MKESVETLRNSASLSYLYTIELLFSWNPFCLFGRTLIVYILICLYRLTIQKTIYDISLTGARSHLAESHQLSANMIYIERLSTIRIIRLNFAWLAAMFA